MRFGSSRRSAYPHQGQECQFDPSFPGADSNGPGGRSRSSLPKSCPSNASSMSILPTSSSGSACTKRRTDATLRRRELGWRAAYSDAIKLRSRPVDPSRRAHLLELLDRCAQGLCGRVPLLHAAVQSATYEARRMRRRASSPSSISRHGRRGGPRHAFARTPVDGLAAVRAKHIRDSRPAPILAKIDRALSVGAGAQDKSQESVS